MKKRNQIINLQDENLLNQNFMDDLDEQIEFELRGQIIRGIRNRLALKAIRPIGNRLLLNIYDADEE